MHSDDVSNKGALVHRCDVSIGDPVGQRRLRAAGPAVRDEVELTAHVPIGSCVVGYRCDI